MKLSRELIEKCEALEIKKPTPLREPWAGIHTFIVPGWTPPRANEWVGRHWAVKNRFKEHSAALIAHYARDVPKALLPRKVGLVVTLAKGQKTPDEDAYDKLLLDALVQCGLLIDDGKRGLVGRMEIEFARSTAAGSTQITLEDVP